MIKHPTVSISDDVKISYSEKQIVLSKNFQNIQKK